MVTMEPIREIRPKLTGEFGPQEFVPHTEAIAEAYRWGQELHAGQMRFSGEPYFETHCVWVAGFIDNLVHNEAWTIAALLHDSVEDQSETLEVIRAHFPGPLGEEVAHVVDGVTKLSNPLGGRSRELETLRKITSFRDPGVFLVKLADKSHNIMTLQYMSKAKRIKKAEEAIRAYGKLAGILNCYKWRRWLEDMAFPYADPDTFSFVRNNIDSDPRLNTNFINGIMQQLVSIMEKAGLNGRIEITVNGYWQAWQKLRQMARMRKASLNNFSAVNDLISFRMVVDTPSTLDCYRLLYEVNRYWGPYLDQNRFDDYIAFPQNGYQALQVTAWLPDYGAIEIAIATAEMEGENLWGVVYAIQHSQDISSYSPVAILTPTGGVRFVPDGSTVLDAVASIQQEFLLDKISAVKVNDTMARLSDKVHPGDVVEVITGGQRLAPSEEWLNYANRSTTRLLRAVLATESLRRSAEKGREEIKRVLSSRGILNLEDVQAQERDKIDNLLERLACASLEDLYAAFGGGAIRDEDLGSALDDMKISKESLQWMTINILGSAEANRPGVLSRLAGLVSKAGGNIVRSVNNTLPNGGFSLRLVIRNLDEERRQLLIDSYQNCDIAFDLIEFV